jgi:dimethylaniline monooxygenase (N-oxide forming)
MYVHPLVRDSMIIWDSYNFIALDSAWYATGSIFGFDQFVGGVSLDRLHVSKGK